MREAPLTGGVFCTNLHLPVCGIVESMTDNNAIIEGNYEKGFNPQVKVEEFHDKFEFPNRTTPTLDIPEKELRLKLIQEEVEELEKAYAEGDFVEVVDALADIAYVVYGAAAQHGVDLEQVFAEVHRSNMSKGGGKNADGKQGKGADYSPPNILAVLRAQGFEG